MPSVAYRRPWRKSAQRIGCGLELGSGQVQVLADRHAHGGAHGRLDGRPAHLAVALGGMAISHGQTRPGHEHGEIQGRPRHEVAGVHVAAMEVRGNRGARPRLGRDAHLPAERSQRYADAGPELGPIGAGRERGDLVGGVREVIGQQPKARDGGRPAPVARGEVEQVDLQRVPWLRAADLDRPVHLVHLVEDQGGDVAHRGAGGQLAIRGIEAVKLDHFARGHARHGRDGRVPGQVILPAGDVHGGGRQGHRSGLQRLAGRWYAAPFRSRRGSGYTPVPAVALAQLAEHRIVAPKVTGSSPVGHPINHARNRPI